MAIKPSTDYSGQIDTSDPTGYPHGKAQNVVVSGDGSGTPLEAAWVNDLFGLIQALLDSAGITPSGTPDKVGASDVLDALNTRLGTTGNLIGASGDMINGAWTAHYFDATSENGDPTAAVFGKDGTRLYVTGNSPGEINQYNLSVAYDQTTAVHEAVVATTAALNAVSGIDWNPDGSEFFVCGQDDSPLGPVVQSYTCTVPWEIGVVATGDNWLPGDLHSTAHADAFKFSADGTIGFLQGQSTGAVEVIYSYTLSAPWDISSPGAPTATLIAENFDGQDGQHFDLSEDGKRLFVLDATSRLWEYHLPTANSLTNAVRLERNRSFFVTNPATPIKSVSFAVGHDARACIVDAETGSVQSIYSSTVRVF